MPRTAHNNFIDIHLVEEKILRDILKAAKHEKKVHADGQGERPLRGHHIALLFEKPSTRTRVSFEVGVHQLGGQFTTLMANDIQLGRGETIADTARVLSRYVDLIMLRCFKHQTLLELAEYSTVPVINGLSDYSHPCQIMADVMTFEEHKGAISGKTVAWVGDGNNVLTSWIHAAGQFQFNLNIACPETLKPSQQVMDAAKKSGAKIKLFPFAEAAVSNADAVVTDTWVSMGVADTQKRHELLEDYRVDAELMQEAKDDAIFMHCLPAHRGHEVTDEVIDSKQSVVWDEAENRLHVQKAIMLWCLGKL